MEILDKQNIEDIIALTPLQEGMLFNYLKDPGSELYFEQLCLEISGNLYRERFEDAWNAVVQSNGMLRTVFRWEKMDRPVQIVLKEFKLTPAYYHFTRTSPDEIQNQVNKIKEEDRGKTFNLHTVPFRVILCKTGENRYEMIISSHHILYDGWSTGIILKEFAAAYSQTGTQKGEATGKAVKPSFKEFVKWQRKQEQTHRNSRKDETFWKHYFNCFDSNPQLSIKNSSISPEQNNTTADYSVTISNDISLALKDTCARHKVTLAACLYTAWGILLQKYNNSHDILFGTTISGRSAKIKHIENIVGLFINTLPLRITAQPCDTVIQLMHRTQNALREREPYENTSSLIDIKDFTGKTGTENLFDSIVVIENYPLEGLDRSQGNPGDLRFLSYSMFERNDQDITVAIIPTPDRGIRVEFVYHRHLFQHEAVKQLARHFVFLIETHMLHNPESRVDQLSLLTANEKEKILNDFNSNTRDYPKDKTLHQLFTDQAQRTPGKTAVTSYSPADSTITELTYCQVNEHVNQLAQQLQQKGQGSSNHITAIMMERSAATVIAILGILRAGGVYLPIEPNSPAERVEYVLKDSNARLIIKDGHKDEDNQPFSVEEVNTPPGGSTGVSTAPGPQSPSSPAYIIYTSGSTGKPKGVPVEHASAVNLVMSQQEAYPLGKNDVYLFKTPYIFDVSVSELFGWFPGGGQLAVLPGGGEKDPYMIMDAVRRMNVTHINFVPSMFNAFVQVLKSEPENISKLSPLKYIFLAGEALGPETTRAFLELETQIALENLYGPTEATVYASMYSLSQWDRRGPIPIGKPVANTRLYILDNYHQLTPVGIPGQLYIAGSGLARGYLNRPELTAECFIATEGAASPAQKGFGLKGGTILYKSGDLCRWLPDGNIEFLGRMDHQVKIRGFRIEPGEIESRLMVHQHVKEAVVIPLDADNGDKYLCAYIVPHQNELFNQDRLEKYLSDELPHYMIPSYFVPLEAIPLTPSGKANRRALPKPALNPLADGKDFIAPRGDTEKKLADLWSRVLAVEKDKISSNHSFFQLGGHSLKAMLMVSRIHKEFDVKVSLTEIFKAPSIQAQARYIKDKTRERHISIQAVEKKEWYPLSSAQKRLYVLHQMEPGSITYNMPGFLPISEELDVPKIESIFNKLIRRHDNFRTSFYMIDGNPVQRVHDHVRFNIEHHQTVRDFTKPFDLSAAPLLRVGVLKHGEANTRLLVDMHHIIADGVSHEILINEFAALYTGQELAPLHIQYKDFSKWQAHEGEQERIKNQAAFWQKEFSGEIPVLELPTDFPRPKIQAFEGSTVDFQVPQNGVETLKQIVSSNDSTLFMVLLAAFNILLSKLSAQDDICVGTPVAGRPHADLEKTIGMFVNTLVLRNYYTAEKTFPRFLQDVKEKTLDAFENQEYPFEDLVENITVDRDMSRNPLFDVMFTLQNIDAPLQPEEQSQDIPAVSLADRQALLLDSRNILQTSKFDLSLNVLETAAGLNLSFEYSSHLFKEDTIHRFIEYFKNIISTLGKNSNIELWQIDMLTGPEKQQVLYEFNRTDVSRPSGKVIHQLFREQAAKTPGNIALMAPGKQVSYKELDEISDLLASGLQARGIGPDSIVAIMMKRSIHMVSAILGILKAGGAYLPIVPESPGERINYMLQDSSARVLIKDGHAECYSLEDINIPSLDSPGVSTARGPQSSSSPAYIIYTSGSTGKPKGVLIEHAAAVNLALSLQESYPLNETGVYLFKTPYIFDVSVSELFGWFHRGGRLAVLPNGGEKDPDMILDAVHQMNVTHINFVPSMFNAFVQVLNTHPGNISKLSSLKYIFLAGEALGQEITRSFLELQTHIQLENLYGPTEATVYASMYSLSQWDGQGSIPIGKPLTNTRLYILDNHLQLSPIGVPGQLYIAGSGLARGYLNRPELTAECFLATKVAASPAHKGFDLKDQLTLYKSGDLCRWLPDGNIEFLGRIDHQVKIRGFRIEPGEIESRLRSHQHVKEAVVIALDADNGDKYLCAYIVPHNKDNNKDNFDEVQLKESLSKELPHYMVPSYFVPLEELPLTPSGKTNRRVLPKPALDPLAGDMDYIAPRNETEKKLADLWSGVLGIESSKISATSSFFQLGGHSLKSMLLVSRIHKEFHVKVSLTEIFKAPSIQAQARYIKDKARERHISIQPVEEKEWYPLSSAQKRLYVLQQMEPDGTAYNMPGFLPTGKDPDLSRIEAAFNQLIQRHENFRTSFFMLDGSPLQRVHDHAHLKIEYHHTVDEFVRPFDLSDAPLLRMGVVGDGNTNQLIIVDMHHIISDGVSHEILLNDFNALYRGQELAPLHIQYKDFSQWQARERELQRIKDQEDFWLKEFSGDIPVLELTTDYPRPKVQAFEGNTIDFEIPAHDVDTFKKIASSQDSTMFMVLLAAFKIFLSKITTQNDICVGTPVAGRPHADLDKIIGMFVNTIVLRNDATAEKTFLQFLRDVKEKTLDAFENQEYPFEDLVDKLAVNRDTGRNPLFDVMFSMQSLDLSIQHPDKSPQTRAEDSDDLHSYLLDSPDILKTSKFDLSLNALETAAGLLFSFEYATRLFKKESILRFTDYFKNIISAIGKNSNIKLWEIDMLTPQEKQKLLHEFNRTDVSSPPGKVVHLLFREQAERTPRNIAIFDPSQQVTYKELDEMSDHLAIRLQEQGVGPDKIVAIILERSVHMVVGILGILKAGGAYLPITPDYPQERIDYIMKDSQAVFLLDQASYTNYGTAPSKHAGSLINNNHSISQLAYIIYTSGSTGKPKGVMVEHRNLVAYLDAFDREFALQSHDTVIQQFSYMFDAFVEEMYPILLKGGKMAIPRKQTVTDIDALSRFIKENQVTMMSCSPLLLNELNKLESEILKSWKIHTFISGGDVLKPEYIDKLMEIGKVYNTYGPTEATVCATYHRCLIENTSSIGAPVSHYKVYIMDPHQMIVPLGIPGEICIGGKGVTRGYLNRPELTAEKFVSLPSSMERNLSSTIYKTGDLGRWQADGNIEFLGRIDHQVKIRGYRIELGEIENSLVKRDEITEAVVITREDKGGDKYICAYIVWDGEKELSPSQLHESLSGELPGYMIPSYFVPLQEIPLTSNGKIDRKALPKPELSSVMDGEDFAAPENNIQVKMIDLWSDVLDIDKAAVSTQSNFFQLGGHSLKAIDLVNRIHKVFSVEVPIAQLFKSPTVKGICQYVEETGESPYSSIQLAEEKEYYLLSSAQKRLYVLQQMEAENTAYNMPLFCSLSGEADITRFQGIFLDLIRLHEILRTSFHVVDNEPVQKVHQDVDFSIDHYSLEPGETPGEFAQRFIRPFDMSQAPLMRAGILKSPDQRNHLLLDMHHIISDGVSHEILVRDFLALYEGETLPPMRIRYRDFSQWQNSGTGRNKIKQQEMYWLNEFAGDIQLLNLPTDYERPDRLGFDGNYVSFQIDADLTRKIRAKVLQMNVTLMMFLLSVYKILLSKYASMEDIVVGTVVAGRQHADLEPIIGFFVNMLAIRTLPNQNKTFSEYLTELKEKTLNAYENQGYQFEELVNKLDLPRHPGKHPLVDVVFVLRDEPPQENLDKILAKDNADFKHRQVSHFDLMLHATDFNHSISMLLEYSTALFTEKTIERLAALYQEILEQVLENDHIRLQDISISHEYVTVESSILQDSEHDFDF